MRQRIDKPKGKPIIHLKGLPFIPKRNQIFFYDPQRNSEISREIEDCVQDIIEYYEALGYEFCYFPDMAKRLSTDLVRYRFPNWNGEQLNEVGNDLLKSFIAEEDQDIGVCFIRHYYDEADTFSCYQLYDLQTYSLESQLTDYRERLVDSDKKRTQKSEESSDYVMFSVSTSKTGENLFPVYEKKLCLADEHFEFDSKQLDEEIKKMVERLHQEGISEFVLRCMVPVDEKLSRIIITPKYEILLPDYGTEPVQMSPLPKAVFLLFLKHDEGIYFKELVDYREELRSIYAKITNRISAAVVSNSIDAVSNPMSNSINEKCSRIREAFVGRMDERIAQHYFVTGKQGELKRITLPRNLVEWQCKL